MYDWRGWAERNAAIGTPCPYCAEILQHGPASPTRDHIYPRSKGGSDHPNNILIVCKFCNSDKANYTLQEFHALLVAYNDPRADVVLGTINKLATVGRPVRTDSHSGEALNRIWIVNRVLEKLGISSEWHLSSKSEVCIKLNDKAVRLRVTSIDELETNLLQMVQDAENDTTGSEGMASNSAWRLPNGSGISTAGTAENI